MIIQDLSQLLQIKFPDVDIRDDQCETIRLISSRFIAGCTVKDGLFRAKIIATQATNLDYTDELIAFVEEASSLAFVEKLATYFSGGPNCDSNR